MQQDRIDEARDDELRALEEKYRADKEAIFAKYKAQKREWEAKIYGQAGLASSAAGRSVLPAGTPAPAPSALLQLTLRPEPKLEPDSAGNGAPPASNGELAGAFSKCAEANEGEARAAQEDQQQPPPAAVENQANGFAPEDAAEAAPENIGSPCQGVVTAAAGENPSEGTHGAGDDAFCIMSRDTAADSLMEEADAAKVDPPEGADAAEDGVREGADAAGEDPTEGVVPDSEFLRPAFTAVPSRFELMETDQHGTDVEAGSSDQADPAQQRAESNGQPAGRRAGAAHSEAGPSNKSAGGPESKREVIKVEGKTFFVFKQPRRDGDASESALLDNQMATTVSTSHEGTVEHDLQKLIDSPQGQMRLMQDYQHIILLSMLSYPVQIAAYQDCFGLGCFARQVF